MCVSVCVDHFKRIACVYTWGVCGRARERVTGIKEVHWGPTTIIISEKSHVVSFDAFDTLILHSAYVVAKTAWLSRLNLLTEGKTLAALNIKCNV